MTADHSACGRAAPGGDAPTSAHPPLCTTCRRDVESDVWALGAQARAALISVSQGGNTGLVLHHFDDALQSLACLAGFQAQGALAVPPDLAALRRALAAERHAVVSAALAARTAVPRAPGPRPTAPAVVERVLVELTRLRVTTHAGDCPVAGDSPPALRDGAELRAEPRRAVHLPVVVAPGELGATTVDLSQSGAGVHLDRVLEAGARVWVTFCRRCRVEAEGVVRWSSERGAGAAAGVRFLDRLPEAALEGLVPAAAT